MNLQSQGQAQLTDMLIRLSSTLKDKDMDDPSTFAMVSQLVQLLDPAPEPLPQELVLQLQEIPDKIERFKAAAEATGAQDPERLDALAESMKAAGLMKTETQPHPHPHAYPWHETNDALEKVEQPAKPPQAQSHDHDIQNEQSGKAGTLNTYHQVAQHFGTIRPGENSPLKHYASYAEHEPKIDKLIADHGYKTVIGGGKHGKFDLKAHNYNTGHLNIYDPSPESGSSFADEDYTRSWRKIHELAHAVTYPELNAKYGEGRRMGKMGTRTHREARRAVEWEHMVLHKQRELSAKIGIHIPDHEFNKEYNTVMHDAVHRAIHGKFTEPSEEGFHPFDHKIPLEHSLNMIDEHAKKLGIHEDGASFLQKFEAIADRLEKAGHTEAANLLKAILAKGKNAKEQKQKVFGGWKTKEGSEQRAKQMGALDASAKKRYGLETERAPGKLNHAGKIIDKPTLANEGGKIQHIGNPDSLVHEHAHIETAPEGKGLKEHQKDMDHEWGKQNVRNGYKQQARAKEEYSTTALENPLRRRAGLPAHEKEVYKPADRTKKRKMAVDKPGKTIIKEVAGKKGKKSKWLTGTSENVEPEHRERMDQVDRGELKFDKDKGWHAGTSPDAKVNIRAREKSKDKSRKDAKTLMRSIDALQEQFVAAGRPDLAEKLEKAINPYQTRKQWQAEVASRAQRREDAKNPGASKARAKKAMDAAIAAIDSITPKAKPAADKPDPNKGE